MKGETYDKERFSVNLARLKKGNEKFEIVINSDDAILFKQGKGDIRAAIVNEKIFSDAKKGMLASEHLMEQFFKTKDPLKIAELIIKQGESQLTEEYREKKKEEKIKRLIQIIHRNGVDPKTHLPHPITRLENAFEEAKVHLDEFRRAEDQVQDVLKSLRLVLPIKFELVEVALRIPTQHATRAYGTVKSYCKILRDELLSDGTWSAVVELPAGLRDELFDELNRQTHGNVESRVVQTR